MSFDPSRLTLTDLYVDGFQKDKYTKVYANGKMQVAVFSAVSYYGTISNEQDIIKYVQANVVICAQEGTQLVPITWTKSKSSNIYDHDIERAAVQGVADVQKAQSYSNYRVPLYFTVPKYSTGKHYWVAQLNGVTTPVDNPVTVDVVIYHNQVEVEDLEIVDLSDSSSEWRTRVLRYKYNSINVPVGHKLLRYAGKDGMRFHHKLPAPPPVMRKTLNDSSNKLPASLSQSREGNAWIPLMRQALGADGNWTNALCAFVDYKDSKTVFIAQQNQFYEPKEYTPDERIGIFSGNKEYFVYTASTSGDTFEGPLVANAWDSGIVMVLVTEILIMTNEDPNGLYWPRLSFEITDKFDVEDNFGNEYKVKLDWNAGSDYYQTWEVTEFVAA